MPNAGLSIRMTARDLESKHMNRVFYNSIFNDKFNSSKNMVLSFTDLEA